MVHVSAEIAISFIVIASVVIIRVVLMLIFQIIYIVTLRVDTMKNKAMPLKQHLIPTKSPKFNK